MDSRSINKHIAKNTLLLYIRMIVTMAISLYTSRIILNVLGVIDYGIYNVVGGVVIMFGFLNSAMAASTQRFLTFELGRNDLVRLRQVFSMSISIHVVISIIIIIFSETLGVWFVNSKLNIPANRLFAANWVFQFSVFTSVLTILSVPYDASIISHERMNVFAYISILEAALKLSVVYLIQFFDFDKLIFYSILLLLVSMILRIIYGIYCTKHFEEAKYYFYWEKGLFKEMTSFAGWNLFGVFAGIGYGQGVNILLNIFFGPIVNAARAIAFQVMGAVNQLIYNFQIAVNPPITKAFAVNDKDQMNKIVFSSSKFSFYLLLFFIVPLFIEAKFALSLWLKQVPEYTVSFTRLVLIDVLICSLSGPLQILAQATGKVRNYQLIVSSILLLNLPFSYVLLKIGYAPQSTFLVSIFLSTTALVARLRVLSHLTSFPVQAFLKHVLLVVLVVTILILPIPFYAQTLVENDLLQFLTVGLTTIVVLILSIWFIGLSVGERMVAKKVLNRLLKVA